MATPRVFGHEFLLAANLCFARDASVKLISLAILRMASAERTEERFVSTTTSSNDSDHASGTALHNLLGATGKLDSSLSFVWVVANDGNVVS